MALSWPNRAFACGLRVQGPEPADWVLRLEGGCSAFSIQLARSGHVLQVQGAQSMVCVGEYQVHCVSRADFVAQA